MARTRSYSSSVGLVAGTSAYRYALAPYVWVASGSPLHWRLPSSAVGGVDLRSLSVMAAQGGAPQGYAFAACRQSPGGIDLVSSFHMSETPTTSGIQDAWQSGTGYRPQGATLTDLLWDQLTTGSDPTGQDGPKPLTPDSANNLTLIVGGHSVVKQERFRWGIHPHTGRLRDLLRLDFERLWERSNGSDHCRRVLDFTCKKYRIDDWREFVPARLHAHVPGRLPHATTFTDAFTDTDGTNLTSHTPTGGGFTWAYFQNASITVQTNRATTSDAGPNEIRAGDLSSDDHYSQIVVITRMDIPRLHVRVTSGVDPDHYMFQMQNSADELKLFKRVSGSHTQLGSTATAAGAATGKLTANGSSIVANYNGSDVVSVTDTAVTGHLSPGFGVRNGDVMDDFEAADLGAAVVSPWWSRVGSMMGALSIQGQVYGGGNA